MKLRHLPFVDYVEPGLIREGFQSADGIGCSYEGYTGSTMYSPTGDIMSPLYGRMQVDRAWKRSNGSGITVGLIDTGIYQVSAEIINHFGVDAFGTGVNRSATYAYTSGFISGLIPYGFCSHGTRMAGIIGAPRNADGPIGVAWGSNLLSVRHNDDVVAWSTSSAVEAIRTAGYGSNVIAMAWGTKEWFNSIDE